MPSTTKECIEIAIGIDVSGSIGQQELNEFLSEIVGIARTFRGRIKMHLFTHETSVNDKYVVENGDVKKIMELKIHGGGGTSHIEPMKYVNENIKGCKLVVWLTDGYSDLNQIDFKKNKFDSIFVICKNGTEEQLNGKGVRVIKLK
jgi:predicted metal-dependent peptidase